MNLDHLDELLDADLLGDLSQEQAAQLQGALKTDPAARSRFVRSIFIETGLHHLGPPRTSLPGAPPGTYARSRRLPP